MDEASNYNHARTFNPADSSFYFSVDMDFISIVMIYSG